MKFYIMRKKVVISDKPTDNHATYMSYCCDSYDISILTKEMEKCHKPVAKSYWDLGYS